MRPRPRKELVIVAGFKLKGDQHISAPFKVGVEGALTAPALHSSLGSALPGPPSTS